MRLNVIMDGKMNEGVNHRISEVKKVAGGLQKLSKKRCVSREVKVGMNEGIVDPSLLYGFEVWGIKVHEKKRLKAVEMNYLRNISGVRWINRFENEEN